MDATTDPDPTDRKSYVRQLGEAFALLALGLGLVLPLILFSSAWQQARLFSEQSAEELARVLAADARYALLVGSRPDAQALVANLVRFPDLIQAKLLDTEGRVLAEQTTADQARAKRVLRVATPVMAEAQGRDGLFSPPAPDGAEALGQVILTLSLDRAFRFAAETARAALWPLVLLMGFLGVALVRLSRRMLTPLGTLVRHLGEPLERRLPHPPAASPAEVHRLYRAVAAMRTRLAENHRQLHAHAEELEARVAARTQALRAACDAAEQANRAKTLFLANVSHELRTPLQAIILHARLLERGPTRPDNASLAVILRASNQLLGLIEQLLHLARVESGHPIEMIYQQIALGALLDEVVTTLGPTLSSGNQLVLTPPDTEVTLISDRARLTQVLYNLIGNADKFTAGGVIQLTLTPPLAGEPALIEVRDQGIGIHPSDQARIFEPFYQGVHGVAGTVASGIGLGLWLSRRLLEALGGQLTVRSEPRVGSAFRIALPAIPPTWQTDPATPAPSASPSTERAPRPGLRLLLAEDEETIRAPLALFLREAGFVVDECADGTSALTLLTQSPNAYAAVILDHRMPGCSGLDILARQRATGAPTTPAVILTGDDRAPLQAAITRLGAHLMVKPVRPERLIETIATLIASAEPVARGAAENEP